MKSAPALALSFALAAAPAVAEEPSLSAKDRAAIDKLAADALADDRAFEILESLTTEVGPRLGGSEAEARARDWGAAKMKSMGFKNVRIETFDMPVWSRVSESAEITAPFPQSLRVTALGNSPSTPTGGVEGEVVRFATLTDLKSAPMTGLEGKIIFVDEKMTRTQDGSGYGVAVAKRSEATYEAAKRGALAAVIRSVGTDSHRNPHTGSMRIRENEKMAPAAALSNPDADQLARALRLAKGPVTMRLNLQTAKVDAAPGGNVIGEIPGRTDELIVIGGHLDSWDLGTGAIDDASGIAITLAAAKLIDEMQGKPGRTIRVVMWGAEEVGLFGARAYAEAHKDELSRHALAAESDFGAGKIWSMQSKFGEASAAKAKLFAEALRPLGVGPGDNDASGGADVSPLKAAGVPVFNLNQDGTDYFDLHHTPDDTLDKVDPEALKQNVAAWATMLYLAAEIPGGFRD
jgi:hypothetical protein